MDWVIHDLVCRAREAEARLYEAQIDAAALIFDHGIEDIVAEIARHSRSRAARQGWRTRRAKHLARVDAVNAQLRAAFPLARAA